MLRDAPFEEDPGVELPKTPNSLVKKAAAEREKVIVKSINISTLFFKKFFFLNMYTPPTSFSAR